MTLPLWISLALLVFSITLGVLYCFRTGLALWRDLNTFGTALDGTAADLAESTTAAADRSARFGEGMPRLDAAVAQLRESLRRVSVLVAVVQDVRSSLVAVYPRK